ncbi:MAG: MBL fold metallo-hydrolase [Deltaproteobacteria bacterium]|nr:MBL fold metallo-hydrolase [Deltaproteobacteria bacterium]
MPEPASVDTEGKVELLGQAGVRLELGPTVVYFDPYLTEHVFEVEGVRDLRRQTPTPIEPGAVRDADFVLVSHIHMDHCDPTTLVPLAAASPSARIVCPNDCVPVLVAAGIPAERIIVAREGRMRLGEDLDLDLELEVVPAAHPEVVRDSEGHLAFVGYILNFAGRRYYHAGDTSPHQALIEAVRAGGPVDVAMLPVNERNFFRERRGIIGNMTIREAFHLAEEIEAQEVIPIHWDMFLPNLAYPEEIDLLYRRIRPNFRLRFMYPETTVSGSRNGVRGDA